MKVFLLAMFSAAVLLSACDVPSQLIDYPEMGSARFKNYYAQCSACHAPPRPTAHTASEWPSVIARMQEHRIENRMLPMAASEMIAVRDYLMQHAAKPAH